MAGLFVSANAALARPSHTFRFAVIGDYGWEGQPESDVAAMVRGWNPDFVITTGDNNYDGGEASTIDQNIGQYYHQFISPYLGEYGEGDTVNRFFPSLGNHDWVAEAALPYLNYFTLPGIERYYEVLLGNVHLFCIDSDPHEPDGVTSSSVQAQWLQNRLAASTAIWKVVYFHHPPYSSGVVHGSTTYMRWPFRQWGASVVLNGHEHNYERIMVDNFAYMVNGLGGKSLYSFGTPLPESVVRYNDDYGAQLVTADDDSMTFAFYTRTGSLIDRYTIMRGFSYTVGEVMSLMALPLAVADRRTSVVFPAAISPAYAFDQGQGYVVRDTLRYAEGFWLRFGSPQIVTITGVTRSRDTVAIQSGWNLIGSLSEPVHVDSIEQIPSGIAGSGYFGFNGNYIVVNTLLPGKGYWVKATQSGVLVLH